MKKVVTLNSGFNMPTVGLGTWLNKNVKEMTDKGLDMGYRYIDTGRVYMNEKIIGEVLQSKVNAGVLNREDVFISTKMWNNPNLRVESQVKSSLRELKVDYLD
jgi:alcohol dehydrogenase (NADP+)